MLLASPDGRDGSVALLQDVNLSVALVDGDAVRTCSLGPERSAWVHVARGSVQVNGRLL